MPEPTHAFALGRSAAAPDRPLQGLTVLVIEDSRFASEAVRLMCLRSGARIRRADCLAAARRHLRTYRPEVLIVDLGLPDGSGTDLIATLATSPIRPQVMLAISGDATLAPTALAAGADAFVEKPFASLASFQSLILRHLPMPEEGAAARPMAVDAAAPIRPDLIALREDLAQAAGLLAGRPDGAMRSYLAGFLSGIARSAGDPALARAAVGLGGDTAQGGDVSRLAGLVRDRLADIAGGPLGPDPDPAPALQVHLG